MSARKSSSAGTKKVAVTQTTLTHLSTLSGLNRMARTLLVSAASMFWVSSSISRATRTFENSHMYR